MPKKIPGVKPPKTPHANIKTKLAVGTNKVKSAAELGIKAQELGINAKPKTHKGKVHQESRAPKLQENMKTSIFIKGHKTSQVVQDLMRDLHALRGGKDNSKLFLRKSHDLQPFDDVGQLE